MSYALFIDENNKVVGRVNLQATTPTKTPDAIVDSIPSEPIGSPRERAVLYLRNDQAVWEMEFRPANENERLEDIERSLGLAQKVWQQPQPGVPHIDHPYSVGDIVYHNNALWENIHEGENVWEPGVQGTEALWQRIAASPPAPSEIADELRKLITSVEQISGNATQMSTQVRDALVSTLKIIVGDE